MNNYYVYVYLDTRKSGNYEYGEYKFDYEPFYIGKGKKNRYKAHLTKTSLKSKVNPFKNNMIIKIIEETGKIPKIIKYKTKMDELESFDLEIKMIETIGRRNSGNGPLTNLTDGGSGGYIHIWTDEEKAFLRENTIFKNKDFIEKYVNNNNNGDPTNAIAYMKALKGTTYEERFGVIKANEIKNKLSESLKGHKKPQSYIDKLVQRCSKRWKIILPNGEECIITNLSEYCRQYELDQGSMVKVSQGKKNHYKNYKCIKLED